MSLELPLFSISAWSGLLLALSSSLLVLPKSYHPLPLLRLLLGRMAIRVYDAKASASYLTSASLLLALLIISSMVIIAYGIVNFAHYPIAFELIFLYFFIENPYTNPTLKRVSALIKQQQKSAARELIAPYLRRDTQSLSQTGLIKALIESQSLNYFRNFFMPLFIYYACGFVVALSYCLLFQCTQTFSKQTPPDSVFTRAVNQIRYWAEFIPLRLFCLPLLLKSKTQGFRYLGLYLNGSYDKNSIFLLACIAGFCHTQLGGPAFYSNKRYAITRVGPKELPQHLDIQKAKSANLFASIFWLSLVLILEVVYATLHTL